VKRLDAGQVRAGMTDGPGEGRHPGVLTKIVTPACFKPGSAEDEAYDGRRPGTRRHDDPISLSGVYY
jgi:hypothetical protein